MNRFKSSHSGQTVKYSHIKILTGSDLSRRRLPLMKIQSVNDGPVVWLTGCVHGDEVGGMVIIQEVFRTICKQPLLRGTLFAFPLMNPIGFETGSRNITLTKEDLNRSFPGNKNGSLAQRMADRIFTTIEKTNPALVVDIHNDWQQSVPYIAIDPAPAGEHPAVFDRAMLFSRKSGFLVVRDIEAMPSTLSMSLVQRGFPAITIELGESFVVNEVNVNFGVKSIMNLLASLEMISPPTEIFSHPLAAALDGKTLIYSDKPVSSTSGIIRFAAKPGDLIKKGQPFAKIYNPFGKLQETLLSQGDGVVLGCSDSSVAFPGISVMAFGCE
jgi:predicted deacylase